MTKIRIALPNYFSFKNEITLVDSHMNIGGHLDNALLLTLVSTTRIAYWAHLGYTPLNLEGVATIVADAAVQYRSEAFKGETMIIEQALREFSDYGFDIVWKISDKTSQREVARGKTGVLCFNLAKREKTLMPEKLRRILQSA